MARPPKNDAEKLGPPISFRLTKSDHEKYKEKFLASGLSQSEFFREHVLTNTTTVIAKRPISQDARRAIFLLQKTSNNINQLAKVANIAHQSNRLSGDVFLSILQHLQDINQSLIDHVDEVKK